MDILVGFSSFLLSQIFVIKYHDLTRIFGIKIEKSHNRLSENGMHKDPMIFQKWV